MFVHQSHLQPLLLPHHYVDEGWFRTERERVFRPTWHLVGTTHDLSRPGDFITLELCGEAVMVRNAGGALAAFGNVCPHRRSLVRAEPKGNTARLRCQYHGWEFDDRGRAKVPRAIGEDEEDAVLTPHRVATVGELVFVSLAPQGESLREFLGPLHPVWEAGFDGTDFHLADHWEHEFECNWKVVVENSLESYHVPEIHPKTFGDMSPEAACEHVLGDRYTTFTTRTPRDRASRAQDWLVRRLGLPVTGLYTHQNVHPHLTFSCLDVFRMAMVVYPLSAGRSLYRVWVYTARGRRRNPVAWASAAVLRGIVRWIGRKVYWEDGRLYPSTFSGDLGRRDVRFLAAPDPPPPADVLVCESTYGDRRHAPFSETVGRLTTAVREAVYLGGKVLIPAFSLGRAQLIVHILQQALRAGHVPAVPVFVDGPLAADISDVYRDHLSCLTPEAADAVRQGRGVLGGGGVENVRATEDSARLVARPGPCVVIASSGMCDAGRIVDHLKRTVSDPRCTLVLVSYQAEGTTGRQLLEPTPTVRFAGREWDKRINVVHLSGFSAHADRDEYRAVLAPLAGRVGKVRLIHGEREQAEGMVATLREAGFTDVGVPAPGDRVVLG